MTLTSKEAIAFQPITTQKTLANELTTIFKEVMDYRNKITESDSKRINMVVTYFTKKAAPRVLSTIEKHTGFKMGMIVPKTPILNFAILMEFDKNWESVEAMIRRYSGLGDEYYKYLIESNAKGCKTVKELEEFSASLNKQTGKLADGMMRKHKFTGKLYFDVYTAFLIAETGSKECTPFTAEELTAIILHEIGHAMSFIEHAVDAIFKRDVLSVSVDRFIKNAPLSEKVKYLSKVTSKSKPEVTTALNKMNDYIATKSNENGSLAWTGIRVLFSIIFALLNMLGYGVFYLMNEAITQIGIAGKAIFFIKDYKVSDYHKVDANDECCEILADEYVTRFGYGEYLVKALAKLVSWCRLTGLGDMNMLQHGSLLYYSRMLPWVLYTIAFGDKTSPDYPAMEDRYKLIMLNTLKALKDETLSEEMQRDYYRTYQELAKIIDNPSSAQRFVSLCNNLQTALQYLVRTPVDLIFTGRFDREYERLYNQVNSLANNDIYAAAYGLKHKNEGK